MSILQICQFKELDWFITILTGDSPRPEIENDTEDIEDNNEDVEEKKIEENAEANDKTKKDGEDEIDDPIEDIPLKEESTNFSDLEELLFCRSPNQVKVRWFHLKPLNPHHIFVEKLLKNVWYLQYLIPGKYGFNCLVHQSILSLYCLILHYLIIWLFNYKQGMGTPHLGNFSENLKFQYLCHQNQICEYIFFILDLLNINLNHKLYSSNQ